jgi:hypothetical protein
MSELDQLLPLIKAHAAELKKPGILSIRPGYRMENDWITNEPAIVVITVPGAGDAALPTRIAGISVDVRQATPIEAMRYQYPAIYARLEAERPELDSGAFPEVDPLTYQQALVSSVTETLAAKPQIIYEPPTGVELKPVAGHITITCHASPDAGWPTLRDFLSSTQTKLTVGMYDFTSAHILKQLENDLMGAKTLVLTLDHPAINPTADQSDWESMKTLKTQLGSSIRSAWALVRSNPAVVRWIYPTAYHIKVAVRDGRAIWLSSGNWNNSNQPEMDPINHPVDTDQHTAASSDRDWHVIICDATLARTYEAFLTHDCEVARLEAGTTGPTPLAIDTATAIPESFQPQARGPWKFFAPLTLESEPMTVTPLLTPDKGIYQEAMLNLVQSAQQKLYVQLQYIHPSDAPVDRAFKELVDALSSQLAKGCDVRVILSQYQTSNGWLERLQAAGVGLRVVRIQNGLHNKGFVVDSRIVALGSQNWSGDGVLRNRDASVIIENAKAAQYYEAIFLHDWDNLAAQSVRAD